MLRRGELGRMSCFLASRFSIALCFLLALAANWVQFNPLAALLLLTGLIGLFSRLWGISALERVEVTLDARHSRVFAGESISVRYRVKNDKLLPLFWLELCHAPPPRDCLTPDDSLELCVEEGEGQPRLLRRRLAFLMWYQTVAWDTVWTARRRGIYQLRELALRAGDGFGLVQNSRRTPVSGAPTFAVYPRLIPVHTEEFLKHVWSGQTGARGFLEDITVLRDVRDYWETDSWKRIDWRMAARQEELQVKVFDAILPRSLHFIVDAGSFLGLSPEDEELEDMFSLLGSLLLGLDAGGVRCGLSLPASSGAAPVDFFPDQPSYGVHDLLFQIAAFEGAPGAVRFGPQVSAALQSRVGQVYFVTWGEGRTACAPLLERFNLSALRVIAMRPPAPGGGDPLAECKTLLLDGLKGGAAG